MAIKQVHKKLTVANPNEFIELIKRKSSSNPLRKKLSMFIESVILMAGEGNAVADVRSANTLIPGWARVGGEPQLVFGYLWESTAFQPTSEDKQVTGTCFLTLNERGLFHRLYGNNEDAELALTFADFTADEDTSTNKEAVK